MVEVVVFASVLKVLKKRCILFQFDSVEVESRRARVRIRALSGQ
jgi:hypothetical protein